MKAPARTRRRLPTAREVVVCHSCGHAIVDASETGTFLGSVMHRTCAIEMRLDRIEDFLDIDGQSAPSPLFTRTAQVH